MIKVIIHDILLSLYFYVVDPKENLTKKSYKTYIILSRYSKELIYIAIVAINKNKSRENEY
jgi:hypothetical protein